MTLERLTLEQLRERVRLNRLRGIAVSPALRAEIERRAALELEGLDERLSRAQLVLRDGYHDDLSRAVAEARNLLRGVTR